MLRGACQQEPVQARRRGVEDANRFDIDVVLALQ